MTASIEKPATSKSSSRRALLAGALGGIGAVAAGAVGRISPVRGANSDPVLVGNSHTGSLPTSIINATNNQIVISGTSSGSGYGVYGSSNDSAGVFGGSQNDIGVWGSSSAGVGVRGSTISTASQAKGVHGVITSTSPGSGSAGVRCENSGTGGLGIGVWGSQAGSGWGVYGQAPSGIGVYGSGTDSIGVRGRSSNSTGVLGSSGTTAAAKPKTGVYGYANQDSASKGVWGVSGKGVGVYGKASKAGYAVRSSGRVRFDKVSGVHIIPAGSTTVTVSPGVNVSSASFVLLTPKTNIGARGLWFTTQPTADTFKIRMSSARSSNTTVAWLLLR